MIYNVALVPGVHTVIQFYMYFYLFSVLFPYRLLQDIE